MVHPDAVKFEEQSRKDGPRRREVDRAATADALYDELPWSPAYRAQHAAPRPMPTGLQAFVALAPSG